MKLLVILQRSGGIEALARQAGLPVERAASLSEGLLPVVMFAMRDFVRANGGGDLGVRALLAAIELQGDGIMAAQVLSHDPVDTGPGQRLCDQFFAAGTARAMDAGNPDGEAVLPLLTMLVSGYVAAQAGGSGTQGSGGLTNLGPLLDFLTSDLGVEEASRLL